MRRVIVALVLIPFAIGVVFPQGGGNTGLAFLKLGVGSRSLAMGEASTTDAADPSALYYNPAALTLSTDPEVLLMHKEWIQDTHTEYIGASAAVAGLSVGFGVNATSVDNIEIRDTPGPAQGTFSARNAAMGIAAAYRFDSSVCVGVTGNFLYEKILVDEASGFGINLGALYQTPWDIRLGASVSNLGSMNALDVASSTLPRTYRAGVSMRTGLEHFGGILTTSADIVSIAQDPTLHVHAGAELEYKSTFSLRAGYQTGYDAKNFSAGFGIRYGMVHVDYAFIPVEFDLGSTHTFTVLIVFQ